MADHLCIMYKYRILILAYLLKITDYLSAHHPDFSGSIAELIDSIPESHFFQEMFSGQKASKSIPFVRI
jgi:hypothetical protein